MPIRDLVSELREGAQGYRGLSKEEFADLKADLKKLKVPFRARYITSPKYAAGSIELRSTKKAEMSWTEEEFKKLLNYLIRAGFMTMQVDLPEMLRKADFWAKDAAYHGFRISKKA